MQIGDIIEAKREMVAPLEGLWKIERASRFANDEPAFTLQAVSGPDEGLWAMLPQQLVQKNFLRRSHATSTFSTQQ